MRPFQEFAGRETSGGVLLLAATIVALLWANSLWVSLYAALWHAPLTLGLGTFTLSHELHFWVNDGLMAVFFVVGLEIKRELIAGELASPRQAALPILAAFRGVVVPALLYNLINANGQGAQGWGFRWQPSRKSVRLRHPFPYALIGAVLWIAVLQSGVHATIAGVLLAFTIPSRTAINQVDILAHSRVVLDHFESAAKMEPRDILSDIEQQTAIEGSKTLARKCSRRSTGWSTLYIHG